MGERANMAVGDGRRSKNCSGRREISGGVGVGRCSKYEENVSGRR